jgi:hypothetical protein
MAEAPVNMIWDIKHIVAADSGNHQFWRGNAFTATNRRHQQLAKTS